MEDLQATVEIAVDVGRFSNVDLFQRGFYQVGVKLVEPVHPQAKVEVHILKTTDKDYFCPARVLDDGTGAVSKCLQVLYKREECQLNHTFLFRVHCLLDSQKIMECLKKFSFQLEATLHFSNSDDLPDDLTKSMEEVSKRNLKLELDLVYGLFANTLLLFDYGYMAAVEITVHASLVALHQPLMTMPGVLPNNKGAAAAEPATLESILFRALPGMSSAQAFDFDMKMSNAITVHAKLIKILLTVYAHMQNYYVALLRTISRKHREEYVLSNLQQVSTRLYVREFQPDLDSLVIGPIDVAKKLSDTTLALKELNTLEEVVNQVNMNLASTCSLLLALWSHVLDTSCQNKQVRKQLAFKYHKYRVHRFQNGFFTTENPRNAQFDDTRYGIYNWMASEIRSSKYFTELPILPIHNEEADGNIESLPIIFEDVYSHQCKKEPSFRTRSAPGIFSRTPTPSASNAASSHQQNGFHNVTEEIGLEDKDLRSPNSSISSCGEACEGTIEAPREDSNPQKKRKYSGIFRKRKGSYKVVRSERLSVSDDESTKVTLAEFLSSIGDKPPPQQNAKRSSVAGSSSSSTKSKSSSQNRHTKSKNPHLANASQTSKGTKRKKRTFSQHRRSLDEGAQRLLQLIRLGKRSSDVVDQIVDEKSLSRSFSSSALSTNKPSSSTGSSHSSLDAFDDIIVRQSSVETNILSLYKAPANADGTNPILRGFSTTASRRAENRFRAMLRSETFEEPESGISEKPVALSARKPIVSQVTSAKVVTTSASPVSQPIKPVPPVASMAAENPGHSLKTNHLYQGMVKSQSYSMGIERLQNGADDTSPYPRPHSNYMTAVPCGPHGKLKTSHTTLGGLDRVRYGMGLHPGGGTVTTSDLSPFDEPELIQAWGELSTSSPLRNGQLADVSQASSEDISLTNTSLQQSDEDTLIGQLDQSTPTTIKSFLAQELDEKPSEVPLSKFHTGKPEKEGSESADGLSVGSEPGALFFRDRQAIKDDQSSQGSTLPEQHLLLGPRSQSLRVFAGSLECSEEPTDSELLNDLEAFHEEKEKKMRDAVFEPTSLSNVRSAESGGHLSSTTTANASTIPSTIANGNVSHATKVAKINPKVSRKTKLTKILGDLSLNDAEASLITSTDVFNAIQPLRKQRERRHIAEKSRLFGRLHFPGFLYADIPPSIPLSPYLTQRLSVSRVGENEGCHLVVCVHGLDGNSNDLRLVKTYLQLGVPPSSNLQFLMARANQDDTYADVDTMTDRLITEIVDYIDMNYMSGRQPAKISFIGHSLGCLLIRSVVAHERMCHLRPRFYTFLSFSGPHLGTVFNNSALVNTGLWLIQKWKKSACLLQLACKDHADLRKTFIYKLSKKRGLEYFRNILLVASASDRYVPYHSARIEMCKQAFRDKTLGPPYQEMLNNIMKPVLNKQKLNLVRYHVVHALPTATANTMIGRAAHIAVLDSEIFLEKFLLVAGLRYFV